MKMEETEVARRRVKMIAAHFTANDDVSSISTHVFPLNCSSSLHNVIHRRDNKVNFARQGSTSQAYFMRQGSAEPQAVYQNCIKNLNSAAQRRDNKVSFARQGSSSQACFMRQASTEPQVVSGHSDNTLKCIKSSIERYQKYSEEPAFSRPVVQDDKFLAPEPPRFARPNEGGEKMFFSEKLLHASESREWSPKMDIGEYGYSYVILVELPGVTTENIRVEVNDKSLIVKGNRSIDMQKVARSADSLISAYHKRGISQGPYHVAWPLPTNADKDNVSAEFANGLLRINVPKI